MIDAQFGRDDKMREGAAMKAIELRMKADTLMEIFWICVHEEFGHWGENIGVRKGFKAVCYESPMISIIDVLRNLGK
ncbi:hypothetical protein HYR65_00940 [Candidatus Azambacteria bacterium]|nr:hypothetical protein [Candidatus Azambacteria bacterium]